ncbi:MAG: carboxymuconolactone decarboxylase family protein [Rhodocyclaceae bacterium]|nr:carboxymuconolactone decarboxylase family protein [Rhodocyclaceae bacterium]
MTLVKRVLAKAGRARGKLQSGKKNPTSAFGGFRKRTITTRQLIGDVLSLTPNAGIIYRVWLKHEIDPGFREELMLAVSELNQCRYCTWAHHEWAQMVGVSDDELAHIEQLDPTGFNRKKWLAISYVRALVAASFRPIDEVLVGEMKANYSAQEIKEIDIVARIMDIANRSANTWDALLSRLRGGPIAESHVIDELVMSGAFLITAPIVVFFLARTSKQPLMDMVRKVIDLTKVSEIKVKKSPPAK